MSLVVTVLMTQAEQLVDCVYVHVMTFELSDSVMVIGQSSAVGGKKFIGEKTLLAMHACYEVRQSK